ncbi:MAG: 2OG-Fe(II) oxygenase [Burkholderiaceae bacterium]|nr:2OG-Fe(II) oxygenase [Burkholderiaceae bacterium]
MKFSSLASDLQVWLKQSFEQGFAVEAIEQSMRASGYQLDFARRAVAAAAQEIGLPKQPPKGQDGQDGRDGRDSPSGASLAGADAAQSAAQATTAAAEQESSSRILAAGPNEIDAGDRSVQILMALNAPRILLFGNLLAPEECEQLIDMSRGKLTRSNVVDRQTGLYELHPDRTSEGTHFRRAENPLIERIEARIAELTGCPVERGEPIQVLHYGPGHEYKPHFDYFDPSDPGNRKVLSMGGQRVATLIMYLNDVQGGGSTIFPDVGLDVLPRRGNAVFFAYSDDEGRLDPRTLHGGSAVAAGEKWIATKWLRQREYVNTG